MEDIFNFMFKKQFSSSENENSGSTNIAKYEPNLTISSLSWHAVTDSADLAELMDSFEIVPSEMPAVICKTSIANYFNLWCILLVITTFIVTFALIMIVKHVKHHRHRDYLSDAVTGKKFNKAIF